MELLKNTLREKILPNVFGVITLMPFMVLIAIVVNTYLAFWFKFLWVWYFVPLGLPLLSIPQLVGLFCSLRIAGVIRFKEQQKEFKMASIIGECLAPPL